MKELLMIGAIHVSAFDVGHGWKTKEWQFAASGTVMCAKQENSKERKTERETAKENEGHGGSRLKKKRKKKKKKTKQRETVTCSDREI